MRDRERQREMRDSVKREREIDKVNKILVVVVVVVVFFFFFQELSYSAILLLKLHCCPIGGVCKFGC